MTENILSHFKNIKLVAMDVDGVLTNGSLLVTSDGMQQRTFNIKDGYAIQLAIKKNVMVAVISGAHDTGVVKRMEGLGVTEIYTSVKNKLAALEKILISHKISWNECVFIGDDMPDVEVMKNVALPCAPADAVAEVKATAKYISPFTGGQGCVRDILEKILKLQGMWE